MKKAFLITLSLIVAMTFVNCKSSMKIKIMPYPETRMDSVADNYHGMTVADPYRWLEDDNSQETADWVAAENAVTTDFISQIPCREMVKNRLTQLWNYQKDQIPEQVGDYLFFFKNNGLQNQSVLYRQKGLGAEAEVFLDPNTLSQDGTVALNSIAFSDDDKYMAYSLAASGSDWVDIRVMEVATKTVLPDLIKWVKFSGASWGFDSKGFFYSGYDEPEKGGELSAQNQFQKIYYHKLGETQQADKLIYEDAAHPLRYFSAEQSGDGKYIFVYGSEGTHGTEVLVKDVTKTNSKFKILLSGFEYDYAVVDCKDDKALVYTNNEAPNFRLVEVDLKSEKSDFKPVIAENADHLLQKVSSLGGYLMAFYLENAMSKVYQLNMNGELVRAVELPMIGTVAGFDGKKTSTETFYSLTSFTSPATIYKYDIKEGLTNVFSQPALNFDPELFATEQLFYPSKDGTQVSMFVVHRKDMKLDGQNPLYLYGYGGFNISLTPSFSPSNILLMEQGGVYVMVNLRGGGEYGEKWHKGGMLENKQNVFDDFIAAAEYLIEKGYTSKEKLAIAGGSNGGLLVGACMTQRPDLYAVAFPAVGVLDMLRYHKFTIGWGWAVEYGSSDNADQFGYIYKYSPLHNIKKECYPATLVTTGDHDDRVVPAHSFKFAAALQASQACDKPVLIRIDSNAGHGAGKPTAKRIEEAADVFSFMFYNTNTKVK